jgi:hypothetical protein
MVMAHKTMNELIEEAAQWLIIQRNLRPFSRIAKEAGLSPQGLRYRAEQYMRTGKLPGQKGQK